MDPELIRFLNAGMSLSDWLERGRPPAPEPIRPQASRMARIGRHLPIHIDTTATARDRGKWLGDASYSANQVIDSLLSQPFTQDTLARLAETLPEDRRDLTVATVGEPGFASTRLAYVDPDIADRIHLEIGTPLRLQNSEVRTGKSVDEGRRYSNRRTEGTVAHEMRHLMDMDRWRLPGMAQNALSPNERERRAHDMEAIMDTMRDLHQQDMTLDEFLTEAMYRSHQLQRSDPRLSEIPSARQTWDRMAEMIEELQAVGLLSEFDPVRGPSIIQRLKGGIASLFNRGGS